VTGNFTGGGGFLEGPPELWAERLAELALRDGISGFVLAPGSDPVADLQRFAEEVAPAVRERVAEVRRSAPPVEAPPVAASDPVARTAVKRASELVAEEETAGQQGAQMLQAVHQHLRQELAQLGTVVEQVEQGILDAGAARSHINAMALRQNAWTLGAFCSAYCRVVTVHHSIEDTNLFRDLRAADPSLGPVLDRLSAEHEGIAGHLDAIDRALVAYVEDESLLDGVRTAVEGLRDALLPHLAFEEDQLLGPIGRLGIRV
jgi:hemerythrin-like domain-containing protein